MLIFIQYSRRAKINRDRQAAKKREMEREREREIKKERKQEREKKFIFYIFDKFRVRNEGKKR